VKKLFALLVVAALTAAACGGDDGGGTTSGGSGGSGESVTLRLGYFPNVTHATGIVGIENGIFEEALGDSASLETSPFNSGTEAVEAIFSDALDASFVGPNPAINAWQQSKGEAIRIVSGATSGGASLVVSKDIQSPEDLQDKKLSTPDLGNTQDVALRAWLKEQGFEADLEGGGDVSVLPQENAQILETFRAGDIDGAWVPEPWATRLIEEGGGHVLVDEAELWPNGEFVTTHLVVATGFLEENPDVVKSLLEGVVEANDFVNTNADESKSLVNQNIQSITGEAIPEKTMDLAWENLTFTLDPIAASLSSSAQDAVDVGLLEPVDLEGIYDLSLLNEVLAEVGEPEVSE
jgi:NitT/TauT family transport system substrate-binding protein